jgi:hypothetical protein
MAQAASCDRWRRPALRGISLSVCWLERGAMMELDRFWDLIDQARRKIDASKGPEGYPLLDDEDALAEVLATLSPEEIVQFDHRYSERIIAGYNWDLRAALAIIEGGAGDDAFEHFRAELILFGRQIYEAALQDADSLMDAVPLPWGMEGLIYVPAKVYEAKTGKEFPYEDKYEDKSEVPPHPKEPAGLPWKVEDLPARMPRLWAKFHEEESAESEAPSLDVPAGPCVRVIDGHFQSYEGVLAEPDQSTGQVTVILNLFGRPTKVLLERTQIEMATAPDNDSPPT